MTNRISRTALFAALGLSASFVLASCASTPAAEESAPAPEPAPAETSSPAEDSAPAQESAAAETQAASGSWLETIGAAIALAESEAGGTAFAIDDEDDDEAWEIQVAVGDQEWEVTVSADGTSVVSSERDDELDSDERAALDAAHLTLLEGIEAAVAEAGEAARFDDASLDDDDDDRDAFAWEVSFDDDIEVHVSVVDGTILDR